VDRLAIAASFNFDRRNWLLGVGCVRIVSIVVSGIVEMPRQRGYIARSIPQANKLDPSARGNVVNGFFRE
jgi:hypothetical protein